MDFQPQFLCSNVQIISVILIPESSLPLDITSHHSWEIKIFSWAIIHGRFTEWNVHWWIFVFCAVLWSAGKLVHYLHFDTMVGPQWSWLGKLVNSALVNSAPANSDPSVQTLSHSFRNSIWHKIFIYGWLLIIYHCLQFVIVDIMVWHTLQSSLHSCILPVNVQAEANILNLNYINRFIFYSSSTRLSSDVHCN